MNLSGQAVAPLVKVYDLPLEKMLVVVDEINLYLGRLRIRPKGSAGGQNGMKHISQSLGGAQYFPRLRLGIGPQPQGMALEDFVLQAYSPKQKEALEPLYPMSIACVESWITEGLAPTQNKFNR